MIDDKFSKWYPVLENYASQYEFNVTTAPSVEEGLEKLQEYPGSIEAVILGLSFTEGKMQGMEGLLKIKEIDTCIPVIILTAKIDNLQLISECIRLGAHDYFSKPNINPRLLFLQIESAIQQSNQRKKLLNLSRVTSDKHAIKPVFHLKTQNERVSKVYFAYRLNAVACASFENKHETEYLCQMAYDWHFNFLNTLTFYDSDLTIRLRYLYKPGNEFIDPVLVLEFNAESNEQAISRFEEIRQEFDMFMQAKKDFGKTTYYFSPVIDEIDLRNILFPFTTDNFIQFNPEFTECATSYAKSIGFSLAADAQREKKMTLPSLLKPEIKLDSFCEQLFHQKTRTMVEIVLSPVKLARHEIDYLRELLNSITSYRFTDIEKENACETINAYLKTPSKCFNVEVFEAQESRSIGKNLLSAISAAFFESATNVNATGVKISKGDILKKEDEITVGRNWNYLYTLSNIINIFKFPYPFSASIPGIRSYHPIFGFIPENMSKTGVVAGIKNNNGSETPIKIGTEDLRKHLYILGQTGTGKTTILYSMIMDRIKAGKGVCVIDPHGDLHKKILENIPEERKKDIIPFEPGYTGNTIRINLLEYNKDNPQEKSFLIDDLFNFFRQEYDVNQTMGPMFELFMKNSLLLLMDDADNLGSIGDITSIFQNTEFRNDLLSKCKDREVVDFWRETAVKLSGDYTLVNFTPYITSKLNQLLINEYIKPIVVTKKSNIDFREIIDNDKILLVSLSKGKIGKIGVNILGTIILSRIINAALSRESIPENNRKDFTLFVDEFQNFVSQSIVYAMSEARKYRLSLVLANQTLGQLNDSIKQSVLGNVGSTIFFRPGINDVDYIMPYFTPYLTRENMLTLPNYRCIGRFQINNALSLPFIFDTIPTEK
jgi:CheY-like chemotaxis protein